MSYEPLNDEDLERLPKEVRDGILEKRRQDEEYVRAYQQRIHQREQLGILIGFACGVLCGILAAGGVIYYLMAGAAGGICGYGIVHLRSSHIIGIVIFGGGQIAAGIFAFGIGVMIPHGPAGFILFLSSWVIAAGTGAFLAKWAEGARHSQDVGY